MLIAIAFFDRLDERLRAMPGVRAVGMVQTIPIRDDYLLSFSIQGRPSEPGKGPSANYRAISPGYFEALTIPLLRGRLFTNADAPPRLVAVIDEAFAKQHFPARIRSDTASTWAMAPTASTKSSAWSAASGTRGSTPTDVRRCTHPSGLTCSRRCG